MAEKTSADVKKWRDLAIELNANGLTESEIQKRIWKKYKKEFLGEASCKRTVRRFLHSSENPANHPKSFEEAVEDAKGAMRKKIEDAKKREAVQMKAATELIIDGVKDAIESWNHYQPKRVEIIPHNVNYSEETIVLMISDIQAGTYISKEATGGLNEYNWDVLEKQFEVLFDTLCEIVMRHKMVAPINNLHIHLIGDIIEGWDIFKGQAHNIDRMVNYQITGVTALLCEFVDKCRSLFEHIHVVGVPGNHGRFGSRGENPCYVNADNLVYEFMRMKLENFPEITWQFTESWWQLDTIYDYNFFLFHGDDIKSYMGFPYYNFDKQTKAYAALLKSIGVEFDYVEIGHFHTPSELSDINVEKFVNGSWPGGTIYSMKGLVTSNVPTQKLFAVHPKQGVTYRYPIRLIVDKSTFDASRREAFPRGH